MLVGIKGKDWTSITKLTYISHIKSLFNWLSKRDGVKENPADKVEQIMVGEYETKILTVEQGRESMEITREHSPALLKPSALNLFCDIRPSEVRRMTQKNISLEHGEVELQGRQTTARRKRFLDMSDNCVAWMKLSAELPIANLNHQWSQLLQAVKAKRGIEGDVRGVI